MFQLLIMALTAVLGIGLVAFDFAIAGAVAIVFSLFIAFRLGNLPPLYQWSMVSLILWCTGETIMPRSRS